MPQHFRNHIHTVFFACIITAVFSCNIETAFAIEPTSSVKLLKTLDSMQRSMKVQSLSAALRNGNSTWAGAKGMSSQTDSVSTQSIYLIGSTVKTITASCILQLVDEQKLSLDDTIGKYLEPIEYINPKITIRQLLRHQSGLFDILYNESFQPTMLANSSTAFDAEELVTGFIQKPKFSPGTRWDYCNTNYFLLGMIIKKITGNPFYSEFRSRFFDSLKLSSFVIPSFEKRPPQPVAHVWMDLNNDGIQDDAHSFYYNWVSLNSAAGAAGGYYATASDVASWIQKSMRGDLYSNTMQEQARQTVASSGLPGTTYGLGLMKKDFLGYTGYGHPGDLSYSSSAWYFPSLDVSISVLMNDSRPNLNSWSLVPVVTALLKSYIESVALGVENNNLAQSDVAQLQAFPNPVEDLLQVSVTTPKSNVDVELCLTDILGRELQRMQCTFQEQGTHSFSVPMPNSISNGVFLLRYSVDGTTQKSITLLKKTQ